MFGYNIDLGFINFLGYLSTAVILLTVFMIVYSRSTPYNEAQEIKDGNIAAALAYGGAILGFVFPLVSAIFFTHSYLEMIKWAVITGIVQMILFQIMHRLNGCGNCIQKRNVAPAILLAALSVAVGLLNAVSMSY
jgi:putative membrane protein